MTRATLLAPFAALVLGAAGSAGAADSRLRNADAPVPPPAPGSLESAVPERPAPAYTPPPSSSTATLTLYLVLMVGLLGGGTYLVRNGFTLFQPKMKGARKLQISETRMLGNRQFLIVAEYEDRKMLLGVCPGRIDYLATLGAAEPEFPSVGLEKSDE